MDPVTFYEVMIIGDSSQRSCCMFSGIRITVNFVLAWRQILFHTSLEAAFTCELFCLFSMLVYTTENGTFSWYHLEKVSIPEMNRGILHFHFVPKKYLTHFAYDEENKL